MSSDDYCPRFSFEITEEQKQRADKLLDTYGLRKAIFGIILDDLLDLIESGGGMAIGAILSTKIKPSKMLKSMKKAEELTDG